MEQSKFYLTESQLTKLVTNTVMRLNENDCSINEGFMDYAKSVGSTIGNAFKTAHTTGKEMSKKADDEREDERIKTQNEEEKQVFIKKAIDEFKTYANAMRQANKLKPVLDKYKQILITKYNVNPFEVGFIPTPNDRKNYPDLVGIADKIKQNTNDLKAKSLNTKPIKRGGFVSNARHA